MAATASKTYALLALAVMKTFSMWKLVNCIWAIITDGEKTPDADSAAPKIAPARLLVSNVCDMIYQKLNHLSRYLKVNYNTGRVDVGGQDQIREANPKLNAVVPENRV